MFDPVKLFFCTFYDLLFGIVVILESEESKILISFSLVINITIMVDYGHLLPPRLILVQCEHFIDDAGHRSSIKCF